MPAALLFGLAAVPEAAAHLPVLRGHLVEVVRQSDLVVVGRVTETRSAGAPVRETTVAVARVLRGASGEHLLVFRGRLDAAAGSRQVFFLRHAAPGLECVQPSGVIFPARAEDDEIYRDTVAAIGEALRDAGVAQGVKLRAALLPALSARPAALRYNAALDLVAFTEQGPPLGADERAKLQRLRADERTDPALRPLLSEALR